MAFWRARRWKSNKIPNKISAASAMSGNRLVGECSRLSTTFPDPLGDDVTLGRDVPVVGDVPVGALSVVITPPFGLSETLGDVKSSGATQPRVGQGSSPIRRRFNVPV